MSYVKSVCIREIKEKENVEGKKIRKIALI